MAMAVMRSPPTLMALFQPALSAADSSTMRKMSLVSMRARSILFRSRIIFLGQTSVK